MPAPHGVVLAKSIPAKAYHISTGEPVAHALKKCPNLLLVPPNHKLYSSYSKRLMELLITFCPRIEQVSIDECYMDFTGYEKPYGNPVAAALAIKDKVRDTFGFTVNIGISTNKLLAKMASDFQKPDRVHTLFSEEIPWATGSPVEIWYALAGMDLARTTPWRLDISPPMIDGISRKSRVSPFFKFSTAVQER